MNSKGDKVLMFTCKVCHFKSTYVKQFIAHKKTHITTTGSGAGHVIEDPDGIIADAETQPVDGSLHMTGNPSRQTSCPSPTSLGPPGLHFLEGLGLFPKVSSQKPLATTSPAQSQSSNPISSNVTDAKAREPGIMIELVEDGSANSVTKVKKRFPSSTSLPIPGVNTKPFRIVVNRVPKVSGNDNGYWEYEDDDQDQDEDQGEDQYGHQDQDEGEMQGSIESDQDDYDDFLKDIYDPSKPPIISPPPEDLEPCSICNKMMKSDLLASHRRLYHPDVRVHKCPHCPYEAKNYYYLWRHKKRHEKNYTYTCVHCSDCFETAVGLQQHFNALHSTDYSPRPRRNENVSGNLTNRIKQMSMPVLTPQFTIPQLKHMAPQPKLAMSPQPKLVMAPQPKLAMAPQPKLAMALQSPQISDPNKRQLTMINSQKQVQFQEVLSLKCRFCPKLARCPSDLVGHEDQHLRPFHCNLCALRSGRMSDLRNHKVRVHGLTMEEARISAQVLNDTNSVGARRLAGGATPRPSVIVQPTTSVPASSSSSTTTTTTTTTSMNQSAPAPPPPLANGKKFQCPKCSKLFLTSGALAVHYAEHQRSRSSLQCRHCARTFAFPSLLKRHEVTGQCRRIVAAQSNGPRPDDPNKQYKCSECPFMTKDLRSLRSHRVLHILQRKFKCPQCSASFGDIGNQRKHILEVHSLTMPNPQLSPQVASVLGPSAQLQDQGSGQASMAKVTVNGSRRGGHVEKGRLGRRGKVKRFKCDSCPYASNERYELKRHALCHEANREFKCSLCTASFSTNNGKVIHFTRIHKKSTREMDQVNQELVQDEFENEENDVDNDGDDEDTENNEIDFETADPDENVSDITYQCGLCPFATPVKRIFDVHQNQHDDEEEQETIVDDMENDFEEMDTENVEEEEVMPNNFGVEKVVGGGRHQCDFCAYTSEYKGNLVKHVKTLHAQGKQGHIKCPHCSAVFNNGGSLTVHCNFSHKNEQSDGKRWNYERKGRPRSSGENSNSDTNQDVMGSPKVNNQHSIRPARVTRPNGKYTCPVCLDEFIRIQDLRDHAEMECSATEEMISALYSTQSETEISKNGSTSSNSVRRNRGDNSREVSVTQENPNGLKITSVRSK